jgi:hypothetical protein
MAPAAIEVAKTAASSRLACLVLERVGTMVCTMQVSCSWAKNSIMQRLLLTATVAENAQIRVR